MTPELCKEQKRRNLTTMYEQKGAAEAYNESDKNKAIIIHPRIAFRRSLLLQVGWKREEGGASHLREIRPREPKIAKRFGKLPN
jgi:hypothetical protein